MFDEMQTLAILKSKQDHAWNQVLRHSDMYFQPSPFQENASGMNEELATIQEEDDEFSFCMLVEKLSSTGFMFNKRILAIDQDSLCYYSNKMRTLQNFSVPAVNALTQQPKVRIPIGDIQQVTIVTDRKSHLLKIAGNGIIVRKGKSNSRASKFMFTFKFENAQQSALWRKLILAAQHAVRSKQYLLTFDNLLAAPSSTEIV